MLRLAIVFFVFVTAALVQAQTISTDLDGKLVELRNKFTQPVKN
jgi:hypothetical protein